MILLIQESYIVNQLQEIFALVLLLLRESIGRTKPHCIVSIVTQAKDLVNKRHNLVRNLLQAKFILKKARKGFTVDFRTKC
jgi:hypothetical protein